MTYTFDDYSFSDLHKDARGYRPGEGFWSWYATASDDEKQEKWDSLIKEMKASEERIIEEEEVQALADFQKKVTEVMSVAAKTRKRAVQWIYDSMEDKYDYEYADWQMGLPYGTFAKELA